MRELLILLFSYFLGSIPFGLIIGKLWKGIDIRDYGSGNIGATNVLRALGPGPAAVVFALDVVKGFVPVALARTVFPEQPWVVTGAALIAVLGHTLSVFLKFRGGKGVATSLGVIVGLDPRVAGIAFGLWVVVVLLSRYVSLASIAASVTVATTMVLFDTPVGFKLFGVVAAAFVIFKHRSNMKRLAQGKEPRWGQKVEV